MSLRCLPARLLVSAAALSLTITATGVAGQDAPDPGSPVTIRIEIEDRSELERLTRLVSIEDVRGLEVRALATPRQLEELAAAGWSWQLEPAATKAAMRQLDPRGNSYVPS